MYSIATIVQHRSASYYALFNQKLILLERSKIVSLFFLSFDVTGDLEARPGDINNHVPLPECSRSRIHCTH